MEAAAALAARSTSQCLLAASAPAAHGFRRRDRAATTVLGRGRAPCGRLRALPPELSEILSPKLVPGSPADTGDVSSLIPVSAVMLLLYFVSNWVVPELILKRLQPTADDKAAATAASASSMSSTQQEDGSTGKIRKKKKKTKSKKEETMNA